MISDKDKDYDEELPNKLKNDDTQEVVNIKIAKSIDIELSKNRLYEILYHTLFLSLSYSISYYFLWDTHYFEKLCLPSNLKNLYLYFTLPYNVNKLF